MRLLLAITAALFACFNVVSGTALTYKLGANDKICFYTNVAHKGLKVAFYFAVQSGGSFDIDYVVYGPTDRIILDGQKERQGDYVFTAQDPGEFRFCFSNDMSTFAEKMIDFEISVENEERAEIPTKESSPPEHLSTVEESIYKISGELSTISRQQKYFRTREHRNFSTVRSTESRILKFSIIEVVIMVTMAALQVFVVKFFFQSTRKGYV
ncbi:emp24/gp25L/p24 family/GOLD-domain-containing protein [Peziza echinospora]|nr:emp24/gp25L/p24 family/GOLD-domain-containing protein [Peziza echinospora]